MTSIFTTHFSFLSDHFTGWCELAYWELRERVGTRVKVPVEESFFDVFSGQTRGAGICISTLAQQHSTNYKPPDTVLKTREKIGLGKSLW